MVPSDFRSWCTCELRWRCANLPIVRFPCTNPALLTTFAVQVSQHTSVTDLGLYAGNLHFRVAAAHLAWSAPPHLLRGVESAKVRFPCTNPTLRHTPQCMSPNTFSCRLGFVCWELTLTYCGNVSCLVCRSTSSPGNGFTLSSWRLPARLGWESQWVVAVVYFDSATAGSGVGFGAGFPVCTHIPSTHNVELAGLRSQVSVAPI